MRCLGQIETRESAERFVAHLLTIDISTQIDRASQGGDLWEIWVRNEDQLHIAQQELRDFNANPRDAKYTAAIGRAQAVLEEKEKKRREAAKNLKKIDMRSRPVGGLGGGGGIPPLTLTILILCIGVGLVTNFGEPGRGNSTGSTVLDRLRFVAFQEFVETNQDAAASLKKGEVWRAITPIFVHYGPLHLAMNMFMLVGLGRIVERWVGTPKFALMVLAMAILPNLLQGLMPPALHGAALFGGFSGVIYGLLGFVWIRSTLNPGYGISIPFPFIVLAIGSIAVGLSGLVPNWPLADLCHLGGLLVGMALGYAAEQSAS